MKIRTLFLALAWFAAPVAGLAADPVGATAPAPGETPSVQWLLTGLNDTLNFETRSAKFRMTVVNPRRTIVYEMQSYGRGLDESVIEYLEPARERGTRYLRRADELWMYVPKIERTQKISGHMLRQGMAGSDMSYEDMTSSTDWLESYDGVVAAREDLDGRAHWKVELTARNDTVTYHRRVIWVDADTLVPSRQELYALSGMLVKRWEMGDVREISAGRHYPFRMKIVDTLREGTYTQIETLDLQLGVEVADEVFSMRWLERG